MAGIGYFFKNTDLSDLDVVIREMDDEGGLRQPVLGETEELPGHKLVLRAESGVLDAQIARHLQTAPDEQPRVHIDVPKGQLEVGRMLLQCIYQQPLHLCSIEQGSLLMLLQLADKYKVPSAVSAVGEYLSSIPSHHLQWQTVLAVYSLPGSVASSEAWTPVFTAAAARLQSELGDLELVFADKEGRKQQLLQSLPHAALLQLLRDKGTRVSSENAAAHALLQWAAVEGRDVTDEQLQQLASHVRMTRCTHTYIAGVLLQHAQLASAVGSDNLHNAAHCSAGALPEAESSYRHLQQLYPAWFEGTRPASMMQRLVMDWVVPLGDIRQAVEEELRRGVYRPQGSAVVSGSYVWQGRSFHLRLKVIRDGDICMEVIVTLDAGQGKCRLKGQVLVLEPSWDGVAMQENADRNAAPLVEMPFDNNKNDIQWSPGRDYFFTCDTDNWERVARALRNARYVQEGGRGMHVRAVLSKIY